MSARVFIDSNVLLYTLGTHPEKTVRAEALVLEGGVISLQVLNEVAAVARRKLRLPWEEVREASLALQDLFPFPLPLTLKMHQAALGIASRYGYHIYDALILAAALEAGCDTLYSEDLQDGQVIEERLTIRNPFMNARA